MKNEAEDGPSFESHDFLNKAVQATGIAANTIKKVVNEAKLGQQRERTTLNVTIRPICKHEFSNRVKLDSLGKGVLKRLIHKFHAEESSMPSMIKLLVKLKREIDYDGSTAHLRGQIKRLGFNRYKTANHQNYYLEKPNVRLQRIEYLQSIKKFRMEGRPIIFTAVTYIGASATDIELHHRPSHRSVDSKRPGAVLCCAGSLSGFVPNATTIFRKIDSEDRSVADFRDKQFENWVRLHLLPNIPKNSVVVLRNGSYNKKIINAAPTQRALKSEMEEWLRNMGVPFHPAMNKPQLNKLINLNKDKYESYAIDKILQDNNHFVLRLPPYHPDLNPVRLAWELKEDVLGNTPKSNDVKDILCFVLNNVTSIENDGHLTDFCEKVSEIEENYSVCDSYIDNLTDEMRPEESDTTNTDSEADGDEIMTDTDDEELE